MNEDSWTADDAQCEVIRENMRAHERSSMNIRLDEKNARKIYNDLSALRDEAMWAEDALGLDDTEEKKILDKALDALLALNQSSPVIIVGVCKEDNSRDVDEAYGAGTYARLFPENDNDSE